MTSKARRLLLAPLAAAERVLRQKYNNPVRNLYKALSVFEGNGVGQRVMPLRWEQKGFKDCYYTVTAMKPRFTTKGIHGRARGVLTWKCKTTMDGKDQPIPNGLKDTWKVLEPHDDA